MSLYHLAQLNIVKMKFEIDAPELAGFFDRMDDINALADESPGFFWRLQEEEEDAAANVSIVCVNTAPRPGSSLSNRFLRRNNRYS